MGRRGSKIAMLLSDAVKQLCIADLERLSRPARTMPIE